MKRRKISDTASLRQMMRDLKDEIGKKAAERCKAEIMDVAGIMAADVKNRAPIYTGNQKSVIKGALKESVKYKWANGFAEITANVENPNDKARYGYILEYTGHPFFYPGIDAHIGEYKERVRKAVKESMTEIGKG